MARKVPVYKLYGEQRWPTPDMVHCESIADRSKLHDWQIKLHQHHGLVQLLYFRGGTGRACLDGRYFDLGPGHLVVVPQMCVHGFRFAPDAVGHVVTLAYPLMLKLTEEAAELRAALANARICVMETEEGGSRASMAFEALEAEYRGHRSHRSPVMDAMLTVILVELGRHAPREAGEPLPATERGRVYFQRFCQMIEDDYASQHPVAHYARRIGITPAYLNVLCRQYVGQSALELIHQRVVLAAKRNLVYTSMTVSVVSYTLGFSDPAYFTRFFKRQVGVSPRAFRKQAATLLE